MTAARPLGTPTGPQAPLAAISDAPDGARRCAAVLEARKLVGTPYLHRGRVPGACLDCAYTLILPFVAAGLIWDFDPVPYTPDWMHHRSDELYVETIELFARELEPDEPTLPADIVVWRWGRTFSHGAIVTAWPWIVHAFAAFRVVAEDDAVRPSELNLIGREPRPMRRFGLRELRR